MNPDSPESPREELEARITALLLGELSATEADMLRRRIAEEPDLARLHDQLKQTIELVRAAAASPEHEVAQTEPLKLSSERREKLLESFKITRPKQFKPRISKATRRDLAALAAMLIGLLAVAGLIVVYRSRNFESSTLAQLDSVAAFDPNDIILAGEVQDSRLKTKDAPNPASSPARIGVQGGSPPTFAAANDPNSTANPVLVSDAEHKLEVSLWDSGAKAKNPIPPATAARPSADILSHTVSVAPQPLQGNSTKGVASAGDVSPLQGTIISAGSTFAIDNAQTAPRNGISEMLYNPTPMPLAIQTLEAPQKSSEEQTVKAYDLSGPKKFIASADDRVALQSHLSAFTPQPLDSPRRSNRVVLPQAEEPPSSGPESQPSDSKRDGSERRNWLLAQPGELKQQQVAEFGFSVGDSAAQRGQKLAADREFVGVPQPSTPIQDGLGDLNKNRSDLAFDNSSFGRSEGIGAPGENVELYNRSGGLAGSGRAAIGNEVTDYFIAAKTPPPSVTAPAVKPSDPSQQPNTLAWASSTHQAEGDMDAIQTANFGVVATNAIVVNSWAEGRVGAGGGGFGGGGNGPRSVADQSDSAARDLGMAWGAAGVRAAKRKSSGAGEIALPGSAPQSKREEQQEAKVALTGVSSISPESLLEITERKSVTETPVIVTFSEGDEAKKKQSVIVGKPVEAQKEAKAQESSTEAAQTGKPFSSAGIIADGENKLNDGLGREPDNKAARFLAKEQDVRDPSASQEISSKSKSENLRKAGGADVSSVEAVGYRNINNLGLLTPAQPPGGAASGTKPSNPVEVALPSIAEPEQRGDQSKHAKVQLTGVVSASGSPRALLEITESEPGRAPTVQDLPIVGRLLQSDGESKEQAAIARKPVEELVNDDSVKVAALGRELDTARQIRDRIKARIEQEKIEANSPKSGIVEIIDPAEAQSEKKPTLGQRLREKLSGEVERSTRLKVERDAPDITGIGERNGNGSSFDPYFIQSESETIHSKTLLSNVAQKLNLNDAWAGKYGGGQKLDTEEIVELLNKRIDVKPDPNAHLMDIRVKSDSPEEAAQIANEVAKAYKELRLENRREVATAGVRNLERSLAERDKQIAQTKEELDRKKKEAEPEVKQKAVVPAATPQPDVQTAENPFSTFSLNVSDVSFKLAAASLEKGVMPEPASVRSEEFINAFDYRDPEPGGSARVAFAWDRARYPFAHNRDIVRFSIKTAAIGREAGRPLNLVLLLDNSGSMERADRVRILQECLRVLGGQLQPQDVVSVVAFSRTARLWVDGLPGSQASELPKRVGGLTPQGGTNLEDAMNVAYQTALRHYLTNGVNRVVLLTDGAANLGDVEPESLKKKVEAHRLQGVALDCFGIGWEGYNDDLLEQLSRNGDGRYGFVNTPEAAASEFAGQLAGALRVAASDVKVQVEFNPRRVKSYRQIGYAKHQLKKEQFRDNTVDAAEIGAAEAGNALYVTEIDPAGEGPLATVRVRYKIPGTSDYREHEWLVPYTGNAKTLEQSAPAMRLASVASAFSEWLVSSAYAGEVTPSELLNYLGNVPQTYNADPRPKKLEWMIRQAKSISGK